MLYAPTLSMWYPRLYVPEGYVPPSPPRERAIARRRDLLKMLRSYTGRLPDPLWFSRIGTPGAMSGGFDTMSGMETHLYGANGLAITAPTSFWALSDTSDSASTNTLTNVGTTTFSTGKIGNAAYLNGSTQSLYVNSNASLTPGAGDYSFWMWVYLSTATTSGIFSKRGTTNDTTLEYELLYLSTPNRYAFEIYKVGTGTITLQASNFGAVPTTTWTFMACTYKHSNTTMAISGNAGTQDTTTGADARDLGNPLHLGILGDGLPFPGRLDAVAWWKGYQLTTTEITTGYNGGNGTQYASGVWSA